MSDKIIGICSICGGRVYLPLVFWSVVPPIPQCESCGAIAESNGPVIPMQPIKRKTYTPPEPKTPAPENVLINEATQIPRPKPSNQPKSSDMYKGG